MNWPSRRNVSMAKYRSAANPGPSPARKRMTIRRSSGAPGAPIVLAAPAAAAKPGPEAGRARGGGVGGKAERVGAPAAGGAPAEEARRSYEAEQRGRAAEADRAKHDPFGSRVPDHSVVHRYARCVSYPEWGVGSVTGIYFTGGGGDVQQWARGKFQIGVRTIPPRPPQVGGLSPPAPRP